ncbi:hypothetical protein, partial [Pseudoalteromonas sp. S1649]|uniref:hypothetical protein n=1 Tax=Pseudoalteromonas sp. S1649 TaxID=579508 RepID=UPI001BB1A54B
PAREPPPNNAPRDTRSMCQPNMPYSLASVLFKIHTLPTEPDNGGIPTTARAARSKHVPSK